MKLLESSWPGLSTISRWRSWALRLKRMCRTCAIAGCRTLFTSCESMGSKCLVHDPIAKPEEAVAEYGIHLSKWEDLKDIDGLLWRSHIVVMRIWGCGNCSSLSAVSGRAW